MQKIKKCLTVFFAIISSIACGEPRSIQWRPVVLYRDGYCVPATLFEQIQMQRSTNDECFEKSLGLITSILCSVLLVSNFSITYHAATFLATLNLCLNPQISICIMLFVFGFNKGKITALALSTLFIQYIALKLLLLIPVLLALAVYSVSVNDTLLTSISVIIKSHLCEAPFKLIEYLKNAKEFLEKSKTHKRIFSILEQNYGTGASTILSNFYALITTIILITPWLLPGIFGVLVFLKTFEYTFKVLLFIAAHYELGSKESNNYTNITAQLLSLIQNAI